jgi:anhydro-N-acetylmuramic acid kinase
MSAALYIGLMSGTSMDGIDAALVRLDHDRIELLASHTHPWPPALLRDIRQAAQGGNARLDQLGQLDAAAGEQFAAAVIALLQASGASAGAVTAIGSHGQTLCHGPDSVPPYSLQIGDPNRIAELTGITTVADFRRRDIAAGGQGAPLVPAFHQAYLRSSTENRVVLNIGGIANITLLPAAPDRPVIGYDTGPGNCLMDRWIERHRQQPYDAGGNWAAEGQLQPNLLWQLLDDPYFRQPPPKSTGTEYFSLDWLQQQLPDGIAPQDVQATLAGLTARSIADAIRLSQPDAERLLVCGGGVHNQRLSLLLDIELPGIAIESTAAHGMQPDWIEAMAFAWLAHQTLRGRPGNLPAATGAQGPRVLGGIYPA